MARTQGPALLCDPSPGLSGVLCSPELPTCVRREQSVPPALSFPGVFPFLLVHQEVVESLLLF